MLSSTTSSRAPASATSNPSTTSISRRAPTSTAPPPATGLAHNPAYFAWVDGLLDRFPDLVVESCSSGSQRVDYALLATRPHTDFHDTNSVGFGKRYKIIHKAIEFALLGEVTVSIIKAVLTTFAA
jgi:hypothetical protein